MCRSAVNVLMVLFIVMVFCMAGCGGGGGGSNSTAQTNKLTSLSISPNNYTIDFGGDKEKLVAVGTYSDNSTSVYTPAVDWSSSDPSIASVSNVWETKGEVTAVAPGTTTITVNYNGVSASTKLTVGPRLVSINLSPDVSSIAVGQAQQLTAFGTYSDGTSKNITELVDWSTSSNAVTVSNNVGSKGKITGKSIGSCKLSVYKNRLNSKDVSIFVGFETVAGNLGVKGVSDGIGAAATFNHIGRMTKDTQNLYVVDNFTIRKIGIGNGLVTTIAGKAGVEGATDGIGSAATFRDIYGITTDGLNLYVADAPNCTIRKVDISTGTVTTIAGQTGVCKSVDGIGTLATLDYPTGITTDGVNLYFTDWSSSIIRKIDISTGTVTTIAGKAGVQGSTDGIGSAATFNGPSDIVADGINLYVADRNTVRKIVISTGAVTTLAGSNIAGQDDGVGTLATFSNATLITTDSTNLYVVQENRLRKIDISTKLVTTLITDNFEWFSGISTDGTFIYTGEFNAVLKLHL